MVGAKMPLVPCRACRCSSIAFRAYPMPPQPGLDARFLVINNKIDANHYEFVK